MNRIKRNLSNQAIGLLPLLLFMFLDNYVTYWIAFLSAVPACLGGIALSRFWGWGRELQFMLVTSAMTLLFYSFFVCLGVESVLLQYSPLIIEVLLVLVLTVVGLTRSSMLRHIRDSKRSLFKRTWMRTSLNEYYFLAQFLQNVYTLHLFIILLFSIFPESMQDARLERFLYRELGIVIGVAVLVYEQIRLVLMRGSLEKEMWLPVLNDNGKVIGCIARSVSRSLPKKYCHPIVRVAVVHNGLLYLAKRSKEEYVSPDTLDHPFFDYVRFRHSIEATMRKTIGALSQDKSASPRFLIRYIFENEKVKHLVSLYVVCLRTEEQLEQCKCSFGKLWTTKQIEENLSTGVFSEYFEKEFAYLKNTILFAENFCYRCDPS